MYTEKTPLCCKVVPWRVQECCWASFCTVEKAVCCPSAAGWLWHTLERRGTCTGGAVSVISKQLLDVVELQGCVHIRVEVKGASSKCPSSLPCLFFCLFEGYFLCLLPALCSVFHAWAPVLFLVWSLQASTSDSVPIHHSPCSFIRAALLPAFVSDTRVHVCPPRHVRARGERVVPGGWEQGACPGGRWRGPLRSPVGTSL